MRATETADPHRAGMHDPACVYVLALPRYKRASVRQFLPASTLRFVCSANDVPAGATVAVWGSAVLPRSLHRRGVQVLRLEDGFLRSVGLGADLVRPVSWVADSRGIYYDATRASDLEWLLSQLTLDQAQRHRADALRDAIVASRLTKYNVGQAVWRRPPGVPRVVLVPGQVEADASIAYGAGEVRTNMGLLRAVRAAAPDAHVVYKPHPDVVARLRAAGADEAAAARWCDEVVTDCDMGGLLDQVDEVHVMTSLAGFEALLRGRQVTCHGMPFYAGWGLTTDVGMQPQVQARRTRRLDLAELVWGALIAYPRYVGLQDRRPAQPEAVLAELQRLRAAQPALPWWRRMARPALAWVARRRDAGRAGAGPSVA